MHRLTVTKEQTLMWNRYQPFRGGIRFFPHIFPIAFPLIFPLGIGLAFWLFHMLFPVIGILLVIALAFFIIQAVRLGSVEAGWNSLLNTGNHWRQRATSQYQQTSFYKQQQQQQQPYYQPSSKAGKKHQPHPNDKANHPGKTPNSRQPNKPKTTIHPQQNNQKKPRRMKNKAKAKKNGGLRL